MKSKRMIGAFAAAAAVAGIAAIPAAQAEQGSAKAKAHAEFLSPIHIKDNGKAGLLKVKYRCDKGDALWVSAKQTKDATRDDALKQEGSSKVAATWLDSHRNPINCNGKFHSARFGVDKVEKGTKGKLREGVSWVQFCITLNEKKLILSHSHWVNTKSD